MKHIVSYFVIFLASFFLVVKEFSIFVVPEALGDALRYLPFFLLFFAMFLQFDALMQLKNKISTPATASEKKILEKKEDAKDHGTALVGMLQEKGRFLDFFMNPIDGYSDEQVAGVARMVHRGCRGVFAENFVVEPILVEKEGHMVSVAQDDLKFRCKLVGSVKGEGPYSGRLLHKGWRVNQVHLPYETSDRQGVITPYEVEV